MINGEAVSVYSNLEKYAEEPFYYWCDRMLEDIYEECNQGKFSLHFCSRQEEISVMEKISNSYENCVQFSASILIRPTPLLERIKGLNQLIRENSITSYKCFKKEVLFVIPDTMRYLEEDLKGLEVQNVFCKIEARVMLYSEYERNTC